MIRSLEEGGSNGHVSGDPCDQVDDSISFPLKSSTASSPTTSTSNSSPPSQRRSPTNTFISSDEGNGYASTTRSTLQRFAYQQQPGSAGNVYFGENEKLRKLKEKKLRNKSRKEQKNVLNTFQVEPNSLNESYDVDNVLESLGELPQVEKKNSKTGSSNNKPNSKTGSLVNGTGSHNHHNHVQRGRRHSNDKSVDDAESKKSASDSGDDESEIEARTTSSGTSTAVRDYASTVEFNHIQENIVLIDEDFKRQVSRSTENLSSFTKVTKKQKRKKKSADESVLVTAPTRMVNGGNAQQPPLHRPSAASASRPRVNGEAIVNHHEGGSSRETSAMPQTSAVSGNVKKPLIQSHSADDFSSSNKWSSSASTASKTDLDLAADFPPLSDGPVTSAEVSVTPSPPANPIWPVLKPSNNNNYTSDSLAVIKTSSASESSVQQQSPPDLTLQANAPSAADLNGTVLPDVNANDASIPNTDESFSSLTMATTVNAANLIATNDGASFIDGSVEIVVSEKKFSIRDETQSQMMAPVTIFCKSENLLNDWTSNSDFTFGFGINEELLSMSFVNADEQTLSTSSNTANESVGEHEPSMMMTSSPMLATLTLNEEDNAIVSFGESLEDLKTVTISPESGISGMCGGPNATGSGYLDASGRSTPRLVDSGASSWADQADVNDVLDPDLVNSYDGAGCSQLGRHEQDLPAVNQFKFNYAQILQFLRESWKTIQVKLDQNSSDIRYYQARI